MSKIEMAVQTAADFVSEHRYSEALAALADGLAEEPGHPQALAESGRILCLLQREDEALECLERAGLCEATRNLASMLATYANSRKALAEKLGIADEAGKALFQRVYAVAGSLEAPARIRISAVLIVKNEERHLERCLASLKGKVDEIVVVDTGSADGTVAIAESFGAKIGRFDWCDDFAAARNASLELASGDWALWIDADETIDESSWGAIWEAVVRPHFGGFFVKIANFTDEHEKSQYTHSPIRLFQLRPEIRFEGRIHEQVSPSIDRLGLPTAYLERALFWHYGYKPSEMAAKNKIERTIDLLLRQIEEQPDDSFHWFNLANAYSVAGRHAECEGAALRCIALLDPKNAFGSLTYQLLAASRNAQGKPTEGLDAGLEAKRKGCFTILNQFEIAHSLLLLGRFADALTAIEASMAMPWPDDMTGDYGIVTHKSHVLKGQILCELGRFDEAEPLLKHAYAQDPNFGLTLHALGCVAEGQGRDEEALEWFEKGILQPGFALLSLRSAARSAHRLGLFEKARDYGHAALQARPEDRESWIWWTKGLEGLGDPEPLLEAYALYAERHEPHADVWVNWGRALEQTGQAEAALAKYSEAVQMDPANANGFANLGDLLYRVGLFAEAASCYEAALRIDPTNPEVWFCLGNAAAQLGGSEAAVAAYRQTLDLAPGHIGATNNLEVVLEAA